MTIKKREDHLISERYVSTPYSIYSDFSDFKQRITKLKLHASWKINISDSLVTISQSTDYVLPKFEIFVVNSLYFYVRVFGWMLTDDHPLYKKYEQSFTNITLSNFIHEINQYVLCEGVTLPDPKYAVNIQKHVIPKIFSFCNDFQSQPNKSRFFQDEFSRSVNCHLLIPYVISNVVCQNCCSYTTNLTYEQNRKESKLKEPAKLNAPIKFTSPERIKLTLQAQRLKCKQQEELIKQIKSSLEKHSKPVDPELSEDFKTLFTGCDQEHVPPFMKLFWEEQQKYVHASSSSSVRYHPMVIKYCLNLAAKSSSAYSDLRYDSKTGSGILVLPSLRTLRDYKNYIHPQRGFNTHVIIELETKTALFSPAERFVTLLLDEMKIQEDLVWDKYTGELIGFVDLGDTTTNYATLQDVKELATHVLVFLVKSVVNPLSYSFTTFATTGANSYQIFTLFWKAVSLLENINLKVIAVTADGASPNRKFFRMHKQIDGGSDQTVVYRTKNLCSKDERFIYFFADVPHLIKTTRNCLANSGSGRATRYMWNDGLFILWVTYFTFLL